MTFDKAMFSLYDLIKSETGYEANKFRSMLISRGGETTARTLINAESLTAGFEVLFKEKRLDLTVEALIVENAEWQDLFSQQEVGRARERLRQWGYVPEVKEP